MTPLCTPISILVLTNMDNLSKEASFANKVPSDKSVSYNPRCVILDQMVFYLWWGDIAWPHKRMDAFPLLYLLN